MPERESKFSYTARDILGDSPDHPDIKKSRESGLKKSKTSKKPRYGVSRKTRLINQGNGWHDLECLRDGQWLLCCAIKTDGQRCHSIKVYDDLEFPELDALCGVVFITLMEVLQKVEQILEK